VRRDGEHLQRHHRLAEPGHNVVPPRLAGTMHPGVILQQTKPGAAVSLRRVVALQVRRLGFECTTDIDIQGSHSGVWYIYGLAIDTQVLGTPHIKQDQTMHLDGHRHTTARQLGGSETRNMHRVRVFKVVRKRTQATRTEMITTGRL
jgi:hypothetical protein